MRGAVIGAAKNNAEAGHRFQLRNAKPEWIGAAQNSTYVKPTLNIFVSVTKKIPGLNLTFDRIWTDHSSSATILTGMNTYLDSLFGFEGKVALLTGAGGYLVAEMSRAAGLAGTKAVCSDLRIEDAQRNTNATETAGLATPVIVTRQLSPTYHPMLQIVRRELWGIACHSGKLNTVLSHLFQRNIPVGLQALALYGKTRSLWNRHSHASSMFLTCNCVIAIDG